MLRFRIPTDGSVRTRERKKEKKTDILITSSVFCAPATLWEITVITADQHVHFLAIDALQSAQNCTCAHNEMTQRSSPSKKKTKTFYTLETDVPLIQTDFFFNHGAIRKSLILIKPLIKLRDSPDGMRSPDSILMHLYCRPEVLAPLENEQKPPYKRISKRRVSELRHFYVVLVSK